MWVYKVRINFIQKSQGICNVENMCLYYRSIILKRNYRYGECIKFIFLKELSLEDGV